MGDGEREDLSVRVGVVDGGREDLSVRTGVVDGEGEDPSFLPADPLVVGPVALLAHRPAIPTQLRAVHIQYSFFALI